MVLNNKSPLSVLRKLDPENHILHGVGSSRS